MQACSCPESLVQVWVQAIGGVGRRDNCARARFKATVPSESTPLLPTSEPLKMQRINVIFIFKRNALKNLSMLPQIIRDPASSTEQLSIRVFYESLQIAFPNIC